MYLAVFVLIAALSSLLAWRSNPMYSTRSSLQILFAVLLMIAAMVGMIVVTVQFASTRSQPVAITIIFASVAAITVAFILGVMKLTLPRIAAVPTTIAMLTVHRRKIIPWAKAWAVAMLLLGALALALPEIWKGLAYAWAGIVGIPGLVVLACAYYAARNQDQALTALQYHPWIHWQYSPTEWQAWTNAEVARMQATPPALNLRRSWWKTLPVPVAIFFGGVLLGMPRIVSASYAAAIFVLTLVILFGSNRSPAHAAEVLRANMTRSAPEVYFGDEGLFFLGTLTPWISLNDWLLDALTETDAPRHLLLRFKKINAGSSAAPTSEIVQRVPLPPSPATDLARLQSELKARCPTANISLC